MNKLMTRAAELAGKAGGEKLQKAVARAALKIDKESPRILVAVGIVSVVGAGVMACRATLKVDRVIDDAKVKLDEIHECEGNGDEEAYSEDDAKKDKAIVYARTGLELAKLYSPAIVMGAAGVFMILESHHIMEERNAALISAYEIASTGFKQYRAHIREKYGEEEDKRALYGLKSESVEVEKEDASGRKRKGKKEVNSFDPNAISRYAVIFDEQSSQWERSPEYNKSFVIGIQNTCNDLLHANGYLFLNTVYSMLGLPETSEGQLVGWLMGRGDDYVDFGIYDDAFRRDEKHRFINGNEPSILLDFNVDGVIYKDI